MDKKNNALRVENFVLTSSRDIDGVLEHVRGLKKDNLLIQVASFMHNTVLVQTLKSELHKMFTDAKVVLLKHDDKLRTDLTFYSIAKDVDVASIESEVLKELYLQTEKKDLSIDAYRNKLLSRYFTDHLTNLPNLYKLRSDLQEFKDFALVIFNIDNFQTINNFYGYVVGDFVIEQVGKYLQENIQEYSIYKLSGDEFAFIIDREIGFYELKEFLENLHKRIKNIVVSYQDIDIYVDFTLGSSINKDNKNIFSNVSMALKYAKEKGVKFWIYEDRMNFENTYERNLKLSGVVREAIENLRIVPYFQAIVDSKTFEVKKYECLARLIDKNEKILSPNLFIPIAKKIKVYNILTKTIIDKSFAAFEDSEYEFSINLSIEDIMCSEIFRFIIEKLKNSKASHRVIFELLESDAIEDYKKVDRFISEVKRYGAKVAIDDFGSGYSNFSYLTRVNVDIIKIDGSLIENIDVDQNAYIVVETIIEFAKKLGIQTVAEYVHSSVIMDAVKNLGVDFSQGFYIDEPSITPKKF
ncbi:MAG: bifunctional diguanylate cyclase/phosphodiesterase [Sulfurimonas sp.]|uniref:EAL domain-containing protein n=1 Tax=Sulfurimonas sp. TaxID=2022749 RepID=UPI00261EAF97|nr:bifunctional diguanylate cyclase/phosphodiesterase [Sulfurimonas sp.]MDD3476046.1 bifunctional diguanylate cyclase/phosphodiesterase [Sulfurimonas sp.]